MSMKGIFTCPGMFYTVRNLALRIDYWANVERITVLIINKNVCNFQTEGPLGLKSKLLGILNFVL